MTHESKVSLETLRFCRGVITERLAEANRVGMKGEAERLRTRLAELDAEIAAKEAEGDA